MRRGSEQSAGRDDKAESGVSTGRALSGRLFRGKGTSRPALRISAAACAGETGRRTKARAAVAGRSAGNLRKRATSARR